MVAGRKPLPKRLKLLKGSFNPSRERSKRRGVVVSAPAKLPVAPKHLDGDARAEWRALGAQLEANRVLTELDLRCLELHCRCYSLGRRLQRAVDRLTSLFSARESCGDKSALGEPRIHPGVAALRAVLQQDRLYLAELGCTPASRARVKAVSDDKPTDPWESLT